MSAARSPEIGQLALLPQVGVEPISNGMADRLLTEWGHYLGPCDRPFGKQSFALHIEGQPVSMATSASTVSSTVRVSDAETLARTEVVELARLCSAPGASQWTRVMLRFWREVFALRWPHWDVRAAVAYSQSARHLGDVYRFDGWTKAREVRPSGGAGQWSRGRPEGDPARGAKSLWLWRYERTARRSAAVTIDLNLPTVTASDLRAALEAANADLMARVWPCGLRYHDAAGDVQVCEWAEGHR